MKVGINQWAFPGSMPAAAAIDMAKSFGFEAFEPCIGDDGPIRMDADEEALTAIRRHAEKVGVELTSVGSGMGWKYALSSPDAEQRQKAKEVAERLMQMAQWLGVDCVLTVPGTVSPEVPYDVALENALAGLQDLVPAAERLQVTLAIENVWNKFLLSPVEMRDFIDQCESEYVGAYFDIGNILLYGYPDQWIRILGNRIRMVHAKDFRASSGNFDGFVMLMEGDVNWPAVMAAFRAIGYDKALCGEFGPYRHSLETMLQHVCASLRTIVTL
ncbi:MAG TPA: sugar phosphate isomerase/epimerase family protein [Candidatus Hydrogenedentes bacterium]|nr:sugar phosphate isomerase/epimerase family protein [Candidatus Hydrogenedentota bacterium]HPG68829.1 sugar phosphate isomerase/epimerase family protein [Candidatus Hydrogenedentota bacterium]